MSTETAPVLLTLEASKALPIGTEIVDAEGYWRGRTHVKTGEVTWAYFSARPEPATLRRAVEARVNNLSPGLLGVPVHVYEPPRGARGAGRAQAAAQRALDEQNAATPAPLDPSKVKAGDTVTVSVTDYELGTYEVKGPVTGHLGGILQVGSTVIAANGKWRDIVTLTAHQPAPEPEPEWKPGTTGFAVVSDGDDVFSMRVMRVEWDGIFGFATESGRIIADEAAQWSVSDFVPDEPRPLPTWAEIHNAIAANLPADIDSLRKMTNDIEALLRGESR